ncbi:MBL fold metallo-hydrolase [Oceanobacillus piezotolerans]|uniref:MBL fold metallo-hydrolase n=1 Tax=Oceanobacillus piezotolerans TaxID=2448030 RepID=A0A498DE36_9BACI|nr:MBL fold metallo-hydrolase [Oceanobacillus piezotolerans]RLL46930.1 MBL fold metallo-hydrolase [Oceanobacillus piezotolerans]
MKKKYVLILLLSIFLVACGEEVYESPLSETFIEEQEESVVPEREDTDSNNKEEKQTSEDKGDAEETALNELRVHFIDVGQADATLFQYDDAEKQYNILYDTGDWTGEEVVPYLKSQGVSHLDLIIVSHPDADHIGQLEDVVTTIDTGEVWLSGNVNSSQTFQNAVAAVIESGADYHEPRTGEEFAIGPLKMKVLYPNRITGKTNEESISILFTYGEIDFIFTGDADREAERYMLNHSDNIEAEVIQLGHHGSNTSSDPKFIEAINPEVAIYSAGTNNSYGHPSPEVVSLIQNSGIGLYGTDIHGTIVVTTNGINYEIETNKEGTINPDSESTTEESAASEDAAVAEEEAKPSQDESSCVNINHASTEEVQEIIHIGPERAQDLISLRPFLSVDDLERISGIGPARIADIKAQGLACVQ